MRTDLDLCADTGIGMLAIFLAFSRQLSAVSLAHAELFADR
jgi:hypothetical protein